MRNNFAIVLIASFLIMCSDEIVTSTPTVFDGPQSSEMLAKFSAIQEEVFNGSCASSGCHSGNIFPDLSGPSSYSRIVGKISSSGMNLIEPGNPDESYLYLKLTGEAGGSRMPLDRLPLSQAKLDSIEAWIIRGAQNN